MSKTNRKHNDYKGRQRRISVRGIRRESPDIRRLGRAIVALALAEAEAEAAAQRQAEEQPKEEHRSAGEHEVKDDSR
jgi:hypothetical protein